MPDHSFLDSTIVLGGGGSVAIAHLGCMHRMLVWGW